MRFCHSFVVALVAEGVAVLMNRFPDGRPCLLVIKEVPFKDFIVALYRSHPEPETQPQVLRDKAGVEHT